MYLCYVQVGCTVVAVLMHFFYLAAFFLMLVEAIELLICIIFVFHHKRKSETTMLIVAGWCTYQRVALIITRTFSFSHIVVHVHTLESLSVILPVVPAVIVAICLAITRTEGYGGSKT